MKIATKIAALASLFCTEKIVPGSNKIYCNENKKSISIPNRIYYYENEKSNTVSNIICCDKNKNFCCI